MRASLLLLAVAVGLCVAEIPQNFDARTEWPQCAFFILNQQQCGSCWDFCSVESFADRLCINGEAPSGTIISPEPPLTCTSSLTSCNGGFPKSAWNWIINNPSGDTTCTSQCFQGCQPYTSGNGKTGQCGTNDHLCTDGTAWSNQYYAGSFESLSGTVKNNLTLYQDELMNNGPLQACFTVYENFYTFFDETPDGIYTHESGAEVGGHCVKMVGWGHDETTGTDYWTFANSWDTTWGDGGYFKMARGTNLCNIEGQVSEGFTKKQALKLGKQLGIHPNVEKNEVFVGGWNKQQVNNNNHQLVIQAALEGLKLVPGELSFAGVARAQTQVVAGINFDIDVKTLEGHIINMKVFRGLDMVYSLVDHNIV
eukprot:CAMPEP_0201520136 /NCGR_PEP_ID=MMETSP0161_2-20130828/10513_1 /ASSEMBLY_ACC=CAM_ASM_000251 /TAXON_ID=180227 /ORGANISM="Neoparamoeba aestuarina, Strain SoJaBio B1-5/56/2" /LENGTH=366 /DNA_ID=CAMNT_0047918405 /DNA_START=53 /DNA_END=1153 /DNA_ORIENTATION=-